MRKPSEAFQPPRLGGGAKGIRKNGATLYFGEQGYITYKGWKHSAGSNEGIFIGEEISRKIQCALYE